jgi:hypothetical protein
MPVSATMLMIFALVAQSDGGELPIRRLRVPRDKLQIFLPKNEIAVSRTQVEFERLLEQYRQNARKASFRRPVECHLRAELDPATRRLVGTSTWTIPAGESSSVELGPWNLTLKDWKGAGKDAVAGLDTEGHLRIIGAPERAHTLEIDWELAASDNGDRLLFEGQIPSCAISHLTVALPKGWELRTMASNQRKPEGVAVELFLAGSNAFALEMVAPSSIDKGRGVLAWQNDQTYRFDDTAVQLEALLQFEALHEQTESVSLVFDEQFRPQELVESTPAQWTRTSLGDGRVRWTATFRRPPVGSFQVRIRGALPLTEGVLWHPPSLQVENAMPRGETMTFSVSPSLRIEAITPGKYVQTYAGQADDKQYRLVFTSTGGGTSRMGSPLLARSDLTSLSGLCREISREAKGKEESPGKRIFSLLRPEEQQLIEDAAEGETLVDPSVTLLLNGLNRLLENPELYTPAAFGGAPLRARVRERLADAGRSATETVRLNRWLLEDCYPREIARKGLGDDLPGVIVVSGRPDVEVGQRLLLDLRREQLALIADVYWRPVHGILFQPTLSVPAGWLVSRVVAEPEERLLRYRSEPSNDGRSVLWLQLAEGLEPGDEFRALIYAEPAQRNLLSEAPQEVRLPEIYPLEFPLTSTSVYTLFFDPVLSYGKEGLPPARNESFEIRGVSKPPESNQYSFGFVSPLSDTTLSILAEKPRFVAEHMHRIEYVMNRWLHSLSIDLSVEQGLLPSIGIVSTRPLPEGLEWQVEGADNSVERVVAETAAGSDALHRYRIDLAVPLERKIRLFATWEVPGSGDEVPLLDVPDCERFQAVVDVASSSGQTLNIEARGLIDADPRSSDDVAAETILWTGAYVRLPRDAAITLKTPRPAAASQAIGNGQAVVRAKSFCQDEQLVQQIGIRLDCRARHPLTLHVPGDSHLWSVMLDGQTVQPRVFDGIIEVSDSLPEGPHTVELVYSHRPQSWMGLPVAELQPPLSGWKILSAQWDVERTGEAILLSSSSLENKGSYRIMAGATTGLLVAPTPHRAEEQSDAVGRMNHAFAALDPKLRLEPLRVLAALQEGLPAGWILVVDRESIAFQKEVPAGIGGTFEEWLEAWDWTATVDDRCVVIAAAPVVASWTGEEAAGGGNSWLQTLVASVKNQGFDPTGRFATPATLANELEDDLVQQELLPDGRNALEARKIWSFEVIHADQPEPIRIAFLPDRWLASFSRSLGIAAVVLTFLWGRRAPTHRLRLAALLALCLLLGLHVTGGRLASSVVLALWGVIVASLSLLAFRWRLLPTPRLGTAAAFFLACMPASGQPTGDAVDRYRVLLPYDPAAVQRESEQVVLSEWLLSKLEEGARRRGTTHFVTRADYEGIMEHEEQIYWRGRLEIYASPENTYPYPIALDLGSARVESVTVDGEPVPFLPPGLNARLDFKLANPGLSSVEVAFVTPLQGVLPFRETTFTIPPAPLTDLRLLLGERKVRLSDESLPRGLSLKNEEGRITIVGRSGPTNRIQLRWREGEEASQAPERVDVRSAHLLNITPPTRDLFSVFRYELSGGGLSEVRFSIAPEIVIRRLDVPGLAEWHITEQDASTDARMLVLSFESPRTSTFDVHLQAMVRIRSEAEVDFPAILPLDARSEEGSIGIRLPKGWSQKEENEKFRNAEPMTVERFIDRWKQLGQVPPDGIAIAKQFSSRPLELHLSLQRPQTQWSVDQTLNFRPSPHSGQAEVTATVGFNDIVGSVSQIEVQLPAALEVHRVTGEGLYQWYVNGRELTLLPTREVRSGWQVRISGRYLFGTRSSKGGAAAVEVSSCLFPGAKTVRSRWDIERPTTHLVQIESPREVTVTESGTDLIMVHSEAAAHGFRMVLRPIEPRVEVQSVTMATIDEASMVIDGRFDIDFAQGIPDRLEFRTPRFMTGIEWTATDIKPPRSEIRGRDLVWILEPNRSRGTPLRIDWQYRLPRNGMERLAIPDVSLLGYRSSQRLVLLYNLSEARLEPADVVGIVPFELAPDFDKWPAGVAVPASSTKVSAFRVEANDWRLTLLPRRNRRSEIPLVVNFQEVDIHLSSSGEIFGASRWEVIDQAAGTVEIEIPSSYQIDEVTVGGIRLPYPERREGKIRFPLFRRAAPQDIYVYWSVDAANVDGQDILLPRLTAGGEVPTTLLAVHHPANRDVMLFREREPSRDVPPVDRARWLGARLRRTTESLANAFADWEAVPSPQMEERLIGLLARAELLTLQLKEAIVLLPAAPSTPAAHADEIQADFARLLRRREELVLSHDGAALVRRALLRMGTWDDFEWTQMRALGDETTYYVAVENLPKGLRVSRIERWSSLRLSPQATIEVLSALILLAGLLMPSLWPLFRVYWPAVMMLLAVGWLHLGAQPLVGLVMALISIGATAWIIQGWFTQGEPVLMANGPPKTRISPGTSITG